MEQQFAASTRQGRGRRAETSEQRRATAAEHARVQEMFRQHTQAFQDQVSVC